MRIIPAIMTTELFNWVIKRMRKIVVNHLVSRRINLFPIFIVVVVVVMFTLFLVDVVTFVIVIVALGDNNNCCWLFC